MTKLPIQHPQYESFDNSNSTQQHQLPSSQGSIDDQNFPEIRSAVKQLQSSSSVSRSSTPNVTTNPMTAVKITANDTGGNSSNRQYPSADKLSVANSFNTNTSGTSINATTVPNRTTTKANKYRRSSTHYNIYERPFLGSKNTSNDKDISCDSPFSPSSSLKSLSMSRRHSSNSSSIDIPPNISVKRQWGSKDLQRNKSISTDGDSKNDSDATVKTEYALCPAIIEGSGQDNIDFLPFDDNVIDPEDSILAAYISSLSKTALQSRDIFGRNILHVAARLPNADYVRLILNHPHANSLTHVTDIENGWTPLHTALDAGNLAVAQFLLSHSPDTAAIRDKAKMRPVDVLRSLIAPFTSFQNFEQDLDVRKRHIVRHVQDHQQPDNNGANQNHNDAGVAPQAAQNANIDNNQVQPLVNENNQHGIAVQNAQGTMHTISATSTAPNTLKKIIELKPKKRNGMTEIIAFGSNTNHTLGFADGDDKSIPQKVEIERDLNISQTLFGSRPKRRYSSKISSFINPIDSEDDEDDYTFYKSHFVEDSESDLTDDDNNSNTKHRKISSNLKKGLKDISINSPAARFLPLQITDVQIAKYHSAALSSDKSGNFYVAGSARGGRLGLEVGTNHLESMHKTDHHDKHYQHKSHQGNKHSNNKSHQFTYRQVPEFANKRVKAFALGSFHTVVLTSEGKVFTFGSNEFGQLGYAVDHSLPGTSDTSTYGFGFGSNSASASSSAVSISSTNIQEQHTPRLVDGAHISSESIIGVAASKIHTVAYSENHLLFWGKNIGQMGFTPLETSYFAKAIHRNMPSTFQQLRDARDGGIIQQTPRVYPGVFGSIRQVACSEIATVYITNDEGHVYVLMNNEHFRVKMPNIGAEIVSEESFASYQVSQRKRGKIVKISTSPKGYICALDDTGIVYAFNLRPQYKDPASLESEANGDIRGVDTGDRENHRKGHQIAKNLKVKVLWNVSTTNLQAVDAAVADDGSIIVCTREGTVWRSSVARSLKGLKPGTSNAHNAHYAAPPHLTIIPYSGQGTRYHYEQVVHTNRIFAVRTDALFSQFVMLREEYIAPSTGNSVSLARNEFAHLLPQISGGMIGRSLASLNAVASNSLSSLGVHAGDGYAINSCFSKRFPPQEYHPLFPRNRSIKDACEIATKQSISDVLFENERSVLLTGLIGSSYKYMSFPGDATNPTLPDPIDPHFDLEIQLIENPYAASASQIKAERIAAVHFLFFLARIPAFEELVYAQDGIKNLTSRDGTIIITFEPGTIQNEFKAGVVTFSGISRECLEALVTYVYTDDFFFGRDRLLMPKSTKGDDELVKLFDQAEFDDDKPGTPSRLQATLLKEDIKLEIYKLCRVLGIMSEKHHHDNGYYKKRRTSSRNQPEKPKVLTVKRRYGHELSPSNIVAMFRGDPDRPSSVGRDLLKLVGETYLVSDRQRELDGDGSSHSLPCDILTSRPDVDITLKDGVHVFLHSYILASRSSFFSACFSSRWYSNKDPSQSFNSGDILFYCNLPNISLPVFKLIVAHIYGDYGIELFSQAVAQHQSIDQDNSPLDPMMKGSQFHSSAEFIDFVKQVWNAADELILFRLSEVCQVVLEEFISTSSVCDLLEFCHKHDGYKLKIPCTQYIFENLEYLFENGVLSDLSYMSFTLIEEYVGKILGNTNRADSNNENNLNRFFLFLNDFEQYNESISSLAILKYVSDTKLSTDVTQKTGRSMSRSKDRERRDSVNNSVIGYSSEFSSISNTRRSVSGNGNTGDSELVFSLDMDEVSSRPNSASDQSPSLTFSSRRVSFNTSESAGWHVVGSRKPSFPSSSKTAIRESLVSTGSSPHSLMIQRGSKVMTTADTSTVQPGSVLNSGASASTQSPATASTSLSAKGLDESAFPSLDAWTGKDRRGSCNEKQAIHSDSCSTNKVAVAPVNKSSKLFQALSSQKLDLSKGKVSSSTVAPATATSQPYSTSFPKGSDLNNSFSNTPKRNDYTPEITIKPAKMSKKDRKKWQQMQEEEEKRNAEKDIAQKNLESGLASTSATLNPWKVPVSRPVAIIPAGGNNDKTSSVSMGINESASPFAIYSGNNEANQKLAKANKVDGSEVLRNNKNKEPTTSSFPRQSAPGSMKNNGDSQTSFAAPTLADIIEQEKLYTEIKSKQNKKSLKEIQEEEEFAKWWKQESERVQKEEKERMDRENAAFMKATKMSKNNGKAGKGKKKEGFSEEAKKQAKSDGKPGNKGDLKGKGRGGRNQKKPSNENENRSTSTTQQDQNTTKPKQVSRHRHKNNAKKTVEGVKAVVIENAQN